MSYLSIAPRKGHFIFAIVGGRIRFFSFFFFFFFFLLYITGNTGKRENTGKHRIREGGDERGRKTDALSRPLARIRDASG